VQFQLFLGTLLHRGIFLLLMYNFLAARQLSRKRRPFLNRLPRYLR
jgi:hypothetical protein